MQIQDNLNPKRKQPPHNEIAEMDVIGTILQQSEAFAIVEPLLTNCKAFYKAEHRIIYQAMKELVATKKHPDLPSVQELLFQKGDFAKAGGASYLATLLDCYVPTATLEYRATTIKKCAELRQLIETSAEICDSAYTAEDADQCLDSAEQKILSVRHDAAQSRLKESEVVAREALLELQKVVAGTKPVALDTGYSDLDALLKIRRNRLIVLAARPSVGKSTWMLEILRRFGMERGRTCACFSLEMDEEELFWKIIACECHLEENRIEDMSLEGFEWAKVQKAASRFAAAPIFLDYCPGATLSMISAKCRQLKSQKGALDAVFIDYLQLMRPDKSYASREREVGEISRHLKALAGELNCPIFALSQLNREIEKRPNPVPRMADLRESGSIEQDADVIIFLSREKKEGTEDYLPQTSVMIAKQRKGKRGIVNMYFHEAQSRFEQSTSQQERI